MTKRIVTLLVVAGFLLSSCDWQMPQTVTVTGSPEIYVPSGATVFELDFLDDIAADFGEAMAGSSFGLVGEKGIEGDAEAGDYGEGDDFSLFAELTIEAPVFDAGQVPSEFSYEVGYSGITSGVDLSDFLGPLPESVVFQGEPTGPEDDSEGPFLKAWYEPDRKSTRLNSSHYS